MLNVGTQTMAITHLAPAAIPHTDALVAGTVARLIVGRKSSAVQD